MVSFQTGAPGLVAGAQSWATHTMVLRVSGASCSLGSHGRAAEPFQGKLSGETYNSNHFSLWK